MNNVFSSFFIISQKFQNIQEFFQEKQLCSIHRFQILQKIKHLILWMKFDITNIVLWFLDGSVLFKLKHWTSFYCNWFCNHSNPDTTGFFWRGGYIKSIFKKKKNVEGKTHACKKWEKSKPTSIYVLIKVWLEIPVWSIFYPIFSVNYHYKYGPLTVVSWWWWSHDW